MNHKARIALINVDNFGINNTKNQQNNLFKKVPFKNFKGMIDIFHNARVVNYQNNNLNFKRELFNSFSYFNKRTNLMWNSFQTNLVKIINTINQKQQSNPTFTCSHINVFLHISNDFLSYDMAFVEKFLLTLQKVFQTNKMIKSEQTVKFHFHLIIDEALYDQSILEVILNQICQNTTKRLFLISTIVSSRNLLGIYADSVIIDNYWRFIFSLIKTGSAFISEAKHNMLNTQVTNQKVKIFFAIKDLCRMVCRENKIKGIWVNNAQQGANRLQNDLCLFFNFEDNSINNLFAAFQNWNVRIADQLLILKITFDKINLLSKNKAKKLARSIYTSKVETVTDKVAIITKSCRYDPISLTIPGQIQFVPIVVQFNDDPYKFVLNYAKQFFLSAQKQIVSNDVLVINWNLFELVKIKFKPEIWLFALCVFDVYMTKILTLLQKENIKWMLFSTSYGFESSFQLQPNQKISFLYLTNFLINRLELDQVSNFKINSKSEVRDIAFFHDRLQKLIKIKNLAFPLKQHNVNDFLNNHKINDQQKILDEINSVQDLFSYIKQFRKKTINVLNQEALDHLENLKVLKPQPVKIVDLKKLGAQLKKHELGNIYWSWFEQEKRIYHDLQTLSLANLAKFYKKLYAFYSTALQPKIRLISENNLDNLFLSTYLIYLKNLFAYIGYEKSETKSNLKLANFVKGFEAFKKNDKFKDLEAFLTPNESQYYRNQLRYLQDNFVKLEGIVARFIFIKQEMNLNETLRMQRISNESLKENSRNQVVQQLWVDIYLKHLRKNSKKIYQKTNMLTKDDGKYKWNDIYDFSKTIKLSNSKTSRKRFFSKKSLNSN